VAHSSPNKWIFKVNRSSRTHAERLSGIDFKVPSKSRDLFPHAESILMVKFVIEDVEKRLIFRSSLIQFIPNPIMDSRSGQ
ncbi:hypothetical protein TorRG33x02_004470, partial [Trema orientale]